MEKQRSILDDIYILAKNSRSALIHSLMIMLLGIFGFIFFRNILISTTALVVMFITIVYVLINLSATISFGNRAVIFGVMRFFLMLLLIFKSSLLSFNFVMLHYGVSFNELATIDSVDGNLLSSVGDTLCYYFFALLTIGFTSIFVGAILGQNKKNKK
jgi:hypothetical protein